MKMKKRMNTYHPRDGEHRDRAADQARLPVQVEPHGHDHAPDGQDEAVAEGLEDGPPLVVQAVSGGHHAPVGAAEGERRAEDGDDGGLGHHQDVGAERRGDQHVVHEFERARDDHEGLGKGGAVAPLSVARAAMHGRVSAPAPVFLLARKLSSWQRRTRVDAGVPPPRKNRERSPLGGESLLKQKETRPTHPFLVRRRLEFDKHGHIQPRQDRRLRPHRHEVVVVQVELLLLQRRRLLLQRALQLQLVRGEHGQAPTRTSGHGRDGARSAAGTTEATREGGERARTGAIRSRSTGFGVIQRRSRLWRRRW